MHELVMIKQALWGRRGFCLEQIEKAPDEARAAQWRLALQQVSILIEKIDIEING